MATFHLEQEDLPNPEIYDILDIFTKHNEIYSKL